MNSPETLSKLVDLFTRPEVRDGFKDQRACVEWTNEVQPHLRFNNEYYEEFKHASRLLTMTFSGDLQKGNFLRASGIVRQAIITLQEEDKTLATSTHATTTTVPIVPLESREPFNSKLVIEAQPTAKAVPLAPPEMVTLAWLWNHASWSVWAWFWGALAGAFAAGLWLGQSQLYDQLMARKTPIFATPLSTEKAVAPANSIEKK